MEIDFAFIDIVLALLILAAAVRGAMRGFVTEVGSMAAIILGIGGAVLFSKSLSPVIGNYFGESVWNQVIAFLILFLVIYIAVKLLEGLLHNIFNKLNLQRLDRVLGFFLGIAEGFLLVGVVLIILNLQPFFEVKNLLAGSLFARILFPLLPPLEGIFKGQKFFKNA